MESQGLEDLIKLRKERISSQSKEHDEDPKEIPQPVKSGRRYKQPSLEKTRFHEDCLKVCHYPIYGIGPN